MIGVLALFNKAKLNKLKTAQKVKDFFADDFNHYLNLSGKHRTDLSSPSFDPTGVSAQNGINHQDESMTINIDAVNCVKAFDDAISSCTNTGDMPYAMILYLYYIKRMQDYRISARLGYQSARYYELKSEALVEFAERLDFWRQKDHADLEDLRVFDDINGILENCG